MQIEIEKINSYGDGYGILNNKKVIVPKTAIGDIVECIVTKDKNNNGKYKPKYDSFLLRSLKIISKNFTSSKF